MRFHVISLPHTQTTREFSWCAYTDKVRKFCDMMTSLDHEVYLYAGEENEASVTELITCVFKEEQSDWWPTWDPYKDSWPDGWNARSPWWREMNGRAVREIEKRIEPRDFICIIGGNCQESIAKAFPDHLAVEWGIGYEGTFSNFQVFESYAWMHYLYGKAGLASGRYYDAVIPNFFDPRDFPFHSSSVKEDYLLYLGRITERKGMEVVKEVTRRTGLPLKVAGQGDLRLLDGVDAEWVGVVGPAARNVLMADAKAVLVPTYYIEPFGGVAVEAQLSGTPVITSDWGAFPETVVDGVTGRRCRTLNEFALAVAECEHMDRAEIRDHANRYLTTNVRYEYETYFDRLLGLWGEGWYA